MKEEQKSHESLEDKIGFLVNFYTKVLYENYEKGQQKEGYFNHLRSVMTLIKMYNQKNRNMDDFQRFIDKEVYYLSALYTVAEDIAKGNPDNIQLIEIDKLKKLENRTLARYDTRVYPVNIQLIEMDKLKELENRTLAKYNRVYPVAYALMPDKNDEKSMKKYLLAIDYTKSLEEGGPDMLLLDTESLEKIGEPYKKKGDFFVKKRGRFFRGFRG
ncbi:MAG: hypothetical protein NTZ02_01295 [Candidatus Woesearchaeota archaeon]|nr:hypothetical protein [Candidatus Woesearchaeota archaeon]